MTASERAKVVAEGVVDPPGGLTLEELQARADSRADLLGIARVDVTTLDRRYGQMAQRPW